MVDIAISLGPQLWLFVETWLKEYDYKLLLALDKKDLRNLNMKIGQFIRKI